MSSLSLPVAFPLWRSFRGRIALTFALLVGLLAVSLSLVLGTLMARQSRVAEGSALDTVAHNAAARLAEGLAEREREVRAMVGSATLWSDGLASERVREVIQRSQAVNPYSVWIGVADVAGTVRSATNGMLVDADVSARPWFQAGRQAVHVGDVHPAKLLATLLPRGRDGGPQRFVDVAAPIVRDGRVLGVIGIHGSWDWTRATIDSVLPDNARERQLEVFIFDRQGEPIYAAGADPQALHLARQKLPLAPLDAHRGGHDSPSAASVRWTDGREYLTTAVRLRGPTGANDLGWTIVAREPVAIAFAAARHAAALALGAGLLAALVASMLGAWMASRLTGPLRRISLAALAVEQGATELPLQRGTVEIERLSGALSGMTSRLVQARVDLEQRVADRTVDLERANAELLQLSCRDPLTGVLNRRGLDERWPGIVASARRRGAPVSLLQIDADHFKRVNDRFGHDVGDDVLRALAGTVRQRLREVDLLARIGGEEFLAVLPDTSADGAARVAAALVLLVSQRAVPSAGTITISVGVAELVDADEPLAAAMRRADQALYGAKAGGRNGFKMAALPDGHAAAAPTAARASAPIAETAETAETTETTETAETAVVAA